MIGGIGDEGMSPSTDVNLSESIHLLPNRRLGDTGLHVSPLGYGAVKLGRNQALKYPQAFELPTAERSTQLLNDLLDMGVTYIDTAPAYGLSEQRIGDALASRRNEFVLSTKVGETFHNGQSRYDFCAESLKSSVQCSLDRLRTDRLDIVFVHSPGDDLRILEQSDVIPVLQQFKQDGLVRCIGLSGKTVAGAHHGLDWADVLMVEYHLQDRSHQAVIRKAHSQGLGVIVKKGLASGHLDPGEAIEFVLSNPHVSSLVVGGLNPNHIRDNLAAARRALRDD